MKKEKIAEFHLNGVIKSKSYEFGRDYDDCIMLYNEKGEHFVLCFDTWQQCCEDFRLELDESLYEDNVISQNGIDIEVYDMPFECDCGGEYLFCIKGDKKTYEIVVSNDHNGWYSHSVSISKEGEFVWEENF